MQVTTGAGRVSQMELNENEQNCYVKLTVVDTYDDHDTLSGGGSGGNVFNALKDFDYWAI